MDGMEKYAVTHTQDRPTDTRERDAIIRRRAYEIWCERNGAGGSDLNDWLQAEAEVLGEPNGETSR